MPDDQGEPDHQDGDRTAWARRRSADLAARIARTADDIAVTEDDLAVTYESAAVLRPHVAERLNRAAREARLFAEHEREQARRLRENGLGG